MKRKTIMIRIKARPRLQKKVNSYHPNFNAREIALQGLYQIEVGGHPVEDILELRWVHSKLGEEKNLTLDIIEGTSELEIELDQLMQKYSKKDIRQISTIVRCILRMGIYEILKGEFPAPIIIDTYCTLTRKYHVEEAVKFVNAILDKIYKYLKKEEEA